MPPISSRSLPLCLFLLVLTLGAASTRATNAQDSAPGRKVTHQITPLYPALARQINLAGTVKVVAVVAPDGKVKTVEAVGGSPILIQAAKDAVSRWKFAPAPAESREVIELHFNP